MDSVDILTYMLLRHLLKSFKISCLMIFLALAFLWIFVKLIFFLLGSILFFFWAPFYFFFTNKMKEWKEFWEVNVLAISGSALALGLISFSTHNRIRNQCTSQEIYKPMYQWNKFLVLSNKKFCDFHGRYLLFIVYITLVKSWRDQVVHTCCVLKNILREISSLSYEKIYTYNILLNPITNKRNI
jgi:hypothetical protein